MDDDGMIAEVLPKLEVFAPLRAVVRSQSARSDRLDRRGRANVDSQNPVAASNEVLVDSANDSLLDLAEPAEELAWDRQQTLWAAIMTLPSWMVSFIVHLGLLLVLATCTYVSSQKGPIILELAQADSVGESTMMEITLDEPALDEPFESLESDEIFEAELPPVDLGEQASLPEVYDTTDPFVVTGLPEFSSKPVIASDSGPRDSSESIEFFGTKSYGSDFVFVIDCSSSMGVQYRWDRAVDELVQTLEQLDSKQKFLVLLYNDRNYVMFGGNTSQKLIPANRENKRRIKNWLDLATPFAGTRPGDSVRLALKKKPDAIYFLSDGELRDNTMFDLRFWNVPRRGPDGIKRLTPIHTILLGSNFGRETMRTIAEENNGIFTQVR